jgi:hypothetical protein
MKLYCPEQVDTAASSEAITSKRIAFNVFSALTPLSSNKIELGSSVLALLGLLDSDRFPGKLFAALGPLSRFNA